MTRPTDPLGGPASAGAATPARRQAARWGVASLIVALVATLLVPTTAAANEADTATAGATDASTAVVAVLDADGVRRCAGVVVGELHVLTAAHCAVAVGEGSVLGGAGERRIVGVQTHPAADVGDAQSFDVALLVVDTPFTVDPLPVADSTLERELVAASATTAVHVIELSEQGPTSSVLGMDFTSFFDCEAAFRGFDDSTHACTRASGDDAPCDGDSGSPAVVPTSDGPVVVGIASYGAFGCPDSAPFALARVAPARRWIAQRAGLSAAGTELGYTLLGDDARTYAFGGAVPVSAADLVFPAALVSDPDGHGHWILHTWGGLEPHEAAELHARPCSVFADDTVPCSGWVAAVTATDHAWLAHESGLVWGTNSTDELGDASALQLTAPIVDAAATSSGQGRYLLGADGGVFTFGDAVFHGSLPGLLGSAAQGLRAVALIVTAGGDGYWIVTDDGGVFAFGEAPFLGSVPGVLAPGATLAAPVVSAAAAGGGYVLAAGDGGVFVFGDAPFLGSLGGTGATASVVDIAVVEASNVDDEPPLATLPGFPSAARDRFVLAAREFVADRAAGPGAAPEEASTVFGRTEGVVSFDEAVLATVDELVDRNPLLDTTRLASEWIAANRSTFDGWVVAAR